MRRIGWLLLGLEAGVVVGLVLGGLLAAAHEPEPVVLGPVSVKHRPLPKTYR